MDIGREASSKNNGHVLHSGSLMKACGIMGSVPHNVGVVRDEQPVSRHIAAFFEHGLNLGHGGIVWQAGLFC